MFHPVRLVYLWSLLLFMSIAIKTILVVDTFLGILIQPYVYILLMT